MSQQIKNVLTDQINMSNKVGERKHVIHYHYQNYMSQLNTIDYPKACLN